MITVDAPISFLLGSGLALAASRKEGSDFQSVFTQGFILQSCVLSPVILFFMLRFPDWEWNYLFDAKTFFFGEENLSAGAASIALLIAILNATYLLGFKLSESLIKQNKDRLVAGIIGGTAASILIIMLIMLDQTLHIGTLAEFNQGRAQLIFTNTDFLIAQAGAGIVLGIGFFIILSKQKA